MDATALVASLQEAVPGAQFEARAEPSICRRRSTCRATSCRRWRARCATAPSSASTLLAELTAVDFWPREPRFELVYILVSIEHRLRLRLKVRLPGDDAARRRR